MAEKKKHVFYPMINKTVKNLLRLVKFEDSWEILYILVSYPTYELDGDAAANPLIDVLISELDRQYTRWNKGGENA